ncbi:hypothetical protein [Marinobacter sp. Arc7-DN-1]|nr:hypothetical protein [Marinobacter sp. Arc7-DN-1]
MSIVINCHHSDEVIPESVVVVGHQGFVSAPAGVGQILNITLDQ